MSEGVEPPAEPRRAAEAHPLLTAFIYLLAKDVLPVGYIAATLSRARSDLANTNDPDLQRWAADIARQLTP